MVQWFRLVLQWNPHKRGKILDESGRSHLAVFTTLRHALSKKVRTHARSNMLYYRFVLLNLYLVQVLYVFYMTFYKINTYEVDDTTTIKDLQLLIERDTNIKVKHQVLTSYKGVILTESTASIISQTNVCTINLYDRKHLKKLAISNKFLSKAIFYISEKKYLEFLIY